MCVRKLPEASRRNIYKTEVTVSDSHTRLVIVPAANSHTPTKMTIVRKTDHIQFYRNVEKLGSWHIAGRNVKYGNHFGTRLIRFLKSQTYVYLWPCCISIRKYIHKRNESIYSHSDLYTCVLTTFICKSGNWGQTEWPSTSEWINKWWYVHTMKYC